MKWYFAFVGSALVMSFATSAADPGTRHIDMPNKYLPPLKKTDVFTKPKLIESEKQLALWFPKKEAQVYLAKRIDFEKNYLLFFHWKGSKGDRTTSRTYRGIDGRTYLTAQRFHGDGKVPQTWGMLKVVPRNVQWLDATEFKKGQRLFPPVFDALSWLRTIPPSLF